MPRADEKTETTETTVGAKQGVIRLSDLAVEGRRFELSGKEYVTLSPIQLSLPEIAKIDKMGKKINQWLPAFGKGEYPEGDELDKFQTLLIDLVVATSNVPQEVAEKAIWWQQLFIIGLFQSVAGMDFLGEQLTGLAGIPVEQREKMKAALKPQVKASKNST